GKLAALRQAFPQFPTDSRHIWQRPNAEFKFNGNFNFNRNRNRNRNRNPPQCSGIGLSNGGRSFIPASSPSPHQ
ncbi:hypothetical protein, partial [Paraherbaspirillum soli]